MPNSIRSFSGNYAFLSNFWQDTYGISLEHKFQAAKTDDPIHVARIMVASTPGEAKRLGRTVVLRSDWEQVKDMVMLTLLREKFANTSLTRSLRRRLIKTYPKELIEGNNWGDEYWGMVQNPVTQLWRGDNVLGELLMQVRREVRAEDHLVELMSDDA